MVPEKNPLPETPRYYLTKEEFKALIEQELHPKFARLEKRMDMFEGTLKAFTAMIFTFKEMVKEKFGMKPRYQPAWKHGHRRAARRRDSAPKGA